MTSKAKGHRARCRWAASARRRWINGEAAMAEPFTYDTTNVDKFAKIF
jgi:hypothetical protein